MSTETRSSDRAAKRTTASLTASGRPSDGSLGSYRRYDASGVLIGPWTPRVSRGNAMWADHQRARFRQR